MTKDVRLDGDMIGYDDPVTDPELHGDLVGQLDGIIDPLSGPRHLHRGPGAPAVPRRRHPGLAGGALGGTDRRVRPGRRALPDRATSRCAITWATRAATPIDVLSLSIGYYHETPKDLLFDATMFEILDDLSRHGTVVVCSAGNDATSRPSFPAAFGPWSNGGGPVR